MSASGSNAASNSAVSVSNTNANTVTATASNAPSIAETDPAGGVTITQPPQTATSFYKIAQDNTITIGWNMTDVIATPTSLTLSAVCANGNTYAVGPDSQGRVPGTATNVEWDLYSYQQVHSATPLPQATCTLHMWDDRGPSATERAGYMSPNTALAFALYTPQAYTPLASGWTCTGCSAALRTIGVAPPAFAGLLVTLVVMLWSGVRVLRR
ncbi:hypothetical protein DFH07DRAFT_821810 [Mycena maculata]|uniref:DUF7137 domain-containing protein n=1 Tax=Mycena maculata TaxID=230809 RepID=A0AAD7NBW4_9AGAR|nr:hypothetical protein DFH07DRAFT_821810 [Mycena maculata]